MVAYDLVRCPCAIKRALLRALDDDLEVINETFSWAGLGFVYGTTQSGFHIFPFLEQIYCNPFRLFIASVANIALGLPLSSGGQIFAGRFGHQAEAGGAAVLRDFLARARFQQAPHLEAAPWPGSNALQAA
jgi:hypothetical protein